MTTNGINVCEDAEMDCDGEKVVTMMDVLKEQEDFEDDANAVLGASDEKNCTYSKGYIKRQAIYACMSCIGSKDVPTKWAGICLACSLTCHENHELIELYTKRNFRCDCGNPKFNSHPCQFTPNKTDLNVENIYNQNFGGIYCVCHRPYPDPESDTQGDMIQCIICEDWLHSNHLDAVVPSNDQYSEMICKSCMDKNEFLHDYSHLAVNKEDMDVDILYTSSETVDTAENKVANASSDNIIDDDNETKTSEKQSSIDAEQSSINMSDNVATPSASNLPASEDMNASEKNILTEQEGYNSTEKEEIAEENEKTSDHTGDKQSLMTEEKATPTTKMDRIDNRTQEQVDEDFLLADPMETNVDQKIAQNVAPFNEIQNNTCGLMDEKKSEADEIDMSKSITKTEKMEGKVDINSESKSDNILITEQTLDADTKIEATNEKSDIVATEELESAPVVNIDKTLTTEQFKDVHSETLQNETNLGSNENSQSFAKHTENKETIEKTENIVSAEQSQTPPTSEQPEDINTSTENKFSDETKIESTPKPMNNVLEQSDPCNTNTNNDKNILENNTSSAENSSFKTDNLKNGIEENKIKGALNNENLNDNENKLITTDIQKRKMCTEGDIHYVEKKKQKLEQSQCVRPRGVKKVYHGATFWPSNFRHKLCTCNECIYMYKDLSVLFLIDPDDTVTAYETLGKEKTDGKPASQYEKGMAALSSLGRVQQINAMTEYAKLRDKLLDFLKTFKDKKVVVKEEDIRAFFAGMKPVREPDGVYFCR